jgi:hypothetical protein
MSLRTTAATLTGVAALVLGASPALATSVSEASATCTAPVTWWLLYPFNVTYGTATCTDSAAASALDNLLQANVTSPNGATQAGATRTFYYGLPTQLVGGCLFVLSGAGVATGQLVGDFDYEDIATIEWNQGSGTDNIGQTTEVDALDGWVCTPDARRVYGTAVFHFQGLYPHS